VSKRMFHDRYFKQMMQNQAGPGKKAPLLTPYLLGQYVRGEFAVFMKFLNIIIKKKLQQSHGYPFGQGIHDGVTLDSHEKFQSFGIQLVDPNWMANLVICFGFTPCTDGTNAAVAKLLTDTFRLRSGGFELEDQTIEAMVSDRAAIGVSKFVGIKEQEGCDMHDGDKVGQSAVGRLTRSKDKKIVNPFPEGVEVMDAARSLATHFSYGNCTPRLFDIADRLGDVAKVKPQADLCGTCIAAGHGLLNSNIRTQKAL